MSPHLANGQFAITHGHHVNNYPSKEYSAWLGLKARCLNPRNKDYSNYGERGIGVCQRWKEAFENFIADMGTSPAGSCLDRIDPNGDYEPTNCRWVSLADSNRNKRNVKWITRNGETRTLRDWSIVAGVNECTVRYRLRNGYTIEQALASKRYDARER